MHTTEYDEVLVIHNGDWSGEIEIRQSGAGSGLKLDGPSFLGLCKVICGAEIQEAVEDAIDKVF